MAVEGATNTGNIKGKIDQHVGKNESQSGYKYQYVNTEKNKKLGIITKDNINHILYNLLWDIVSHQVDNETAKGEMEEVNWLLKRYPKDSDRSDDTGVSNSTINKYVKKARDIVGNMKSLEEESIYVEKGHITKHPSGEGKKLSEEVDEEAVKETLCSKYELKFPNGSEVAEDMDLTAAVMYMYGINGKEAREGIKEGKYSEKELQKAIDYWIEKTDGDRHFDEEQVDEGAKENLQYRVESAKALIKNSKEPKNVRRCLGPENKRLRRQLLTGKRTSFADVGEENLVEDTTVGKYSIKKVKEGTVDKWAVYDEAGNLRATYPDEQTAKNAVMGKKIYEEYDPFQDMIKDDEGRYTDGEGGSYTAPSEGTTSWIKKRNFKYRYNFATKEIEIADNAGEVIYSSGLTVGNWLDGPDYWFEQAYKDMEDEDEAFIQEYFKQHPEEDKRNITPEDLHYASELGEEEGTWDQFKKSEEYKQEFEDWKENQKEEGYKGPFSENEFDKTSACDDAYKRFLREEVDEEVGKKFSSAAELEEFLKDKDDLVIYFDKGVFTILDDVAEEETNESFVDEYRKKLAEAEEVMKQYSQDQIDYVEKAYSECIEDPKKFNDIKRDWEVSAAEDEIFDKDDDFAKLFAAIEIVHEQDAIANS